MDFDWYKYRRLRKGEKILATDFLWNEDKDELVESNCVGESAPDPLFTCHRKYLRLLKIPLDYNGGV